jgi:hypothetical protein
MLLLLALFAALCAAAVCDSSAVVYASPPTTYASTSDESQLVLGSTFTTTGTDQEVTGVRWYVSQTVNDPVGTAPTSNTGAPFSYTVSLYDGTTLLASANQDVTPTAGGAFVTTAFSGPVQISAGTTYTVAVYQPNSAPAFYPFDTTAGATSACGVTLQSSFYSTNSGNVPPTTPSSFFYGIEPVVTAIPSGTE